MREIFLKIYSNIKKKIPDDARPMIITVILSLASALSAVAFLYLIKISYALTYEKFAEESKLYFIIASFILISLSSLAVGFLLFVFSAIRKKWEN